MMKTMVATLVASSALGLSALLPPPPTFVWNASESVPVGLYTISSVGELKVTQLVLARPPEPLATYLDEGGYVPRGVPLLKRIAALPGQHVCRDGRELKIDGVTWGLTRERDRAGRDLPAWYGCRTVAEGEVFLMNWDEPASLDGRYFGPIPAASIVGRASPVWVREEG
ncbi:MAG TPA: S26 family signal peptidase [Microvirga sp.]|jgi:conjugative transfer signal peptidase TraF|nr:S26 family signal peptidase [Microvirga sp.]